MVNYRIYIAALFAAAFLFWIIARAILKGRLRTEYSFIWLSLALVLLIPIFWRHSLDLLAVYMGVFYAPSLVFMIFFFLVFIYLLHLSVVNSRQHEQIKKLAQELALLKSKVSEMNQKENQKEIKKSGL